MMERCNLPFSVHTFLTCHFFFCSPRLTYRPLAFLKRITRLLLVTVLYLLQWISVWVIIELWCTLISSYSLF